MISLVLFIIGLFIGSFLNVVIDRVPRGETFVKGHSHCDFCGHTLAWYDLIPLFSFVLLRGTCLYCKKFIGWKYPVIELTTGVAFAASILLPFVSPFLLCVTLGIVGCLIVVFFTDLFSGIIPDSVVIGLFILAVMRIFLVQGNFLYSLFSGVGAGGLFLIIFLITKGKGIGFGDVKYAFSMGILLGFPFIVTGLYVAFLTGAAASLILIVGGKKRFHQTIPLGPFLVAGTVVNLFWGQALWQLFSRILRI